VRSLPERQNGEGGGYVGLRRSEPIINGLEDYRLLGRWWFLSLSRDEFLDGSEVVVRSDEIFVPSIHRSN
jgi:hypothetical protein